MQDSPARHLSVAQVKAAFPRQLELQGFCPVTFVDGKGRYEHIRQGSHEYVAEFQSKLFSMESLEKVTIKLTRKKQTENKNKNCCSSIIMRKH